MNNALMVYLWSMLRDIEWVATVFFILSLASFSISYFFATTDRYLNDGRDQHLQSLSKTIKVSLACAIIAALIIILVPSQDRLELESWKMEKREQMEQAK